MYLTTEKEHVDQTKIMFFPLTILQTSTSEVFAMVYRVSRLMLYSVFHNATTIFCWIQVLSNFVWLQGHTVVTHAELGCFVNITDAMGTNTFPLGQRCQVLNFKLVKFQTFLEPWVQIFFMILFCDHHWEQFSMFWQVLSRFKEEFRSHIVKIWSGGLELACGQC